MGTVGTMYDETVKFGFAKLLQVQTLTNAGSAIFISPFTQNFHTFIFDFLDLYPTAGYDWLWAQVSTNGGVSWLGANYYWGYVYSTSHAAVYNASGNYVVGGSTNVFQLTGGGHNPNPWSGEVILNFRPGKNAELQWHFTVRNTDYQQWNMFGGGVCDGAVNAVQFALATGNTIAKGTIRCYGMRLGT